MLWTGVCVLISFQWWKLPVARSRGALASESIHMWALAHMPVHAREAHTRKQESA